MRFNPSHRPLRPIPLLSGCRLSSVAYRTRSLFSLHNDAASDLSRDQNLEDSYIKKYPNIEAEYVIIIVNTLIHIVSLLFANWFEVPPKTKIRVALILTYIE